VPITQQAVDTNAHIPEPLHSEAESSAVTAASSATDKSAVPQRIPIVPEYWVLRQQGNGTSGRMDGTEDQQPFLPAGHNCRFNTCRHHYRAACITSIISNLIWCLPDPRSLLKPFSRRGDDQSGIPTGSWRSAEFFKATAGLTSP